MAQNRSQVLIRPNVRGGSITPVLSCPRLVRSPSESGRRADPSALRPRARRRHRAASFDRLVGASEQRWRHSDAERLRSLEIDHQLEVYGLFYRDISRTRSLEYSIYEMGSSLDNFRIARAITDQSASSRVFLELVNCRNFRFWGQGQNARPERIIGEHESSFTA